MEDACVTSACTNYSFRLINKKINSQDVLKALPCSEHFLIHVYVQICENTSQYTAPVLSVY